MNAPNLGLDFDDDSDDDSISSLTDELIENPQYCDQQGPSQINDFIFLGSESHASNYDMLENLGINFILNVATNCPNYFEDELVYKSLPVPDVCETNINEIFTEAFNFIEEVKNRKGKVLIHCQAGVSRSVTITTAYLMKTLCVGMDEALKVVKSKRRCAAPNFGFMLKLMEFGDELDL